MGETEVKGYFTEEMTFVWKQPGFSENRDRVFSLCNSESLAKYPGCNECSAIVGWVDSGFWLVVSMGKEHWREWLPQVRAQGQVRAWGALQHWGCVSLGSGMDGSVPGCYTTHHSPFTTSQASRRPCAQPPCYTCIPSCPYLKALIKMTLPPESFLHSCQQQYCLLSLKSESSLSPALFVQCSWL